MELKSKVLAAPLATARSRTSEILTAKEPVGAAVPNTCALAAVVNKATITEAALEYLFHGLNFNVNKLSFIRER